MDFRIIKTVISREYSTRVKKKSFLVTTFVVPILFAAFIVGITYIMGNTKQRKQDVAVVDQSGIVFSHLENTDRLTFADYSLSDPDSLKADLDAIGKDVLVVISPLDTVSKSVSVSAYSAKPLGVEFTSGLAVKVDKAVEEYRVRQYGIDNLSKIMEEVRSDVKINEYTLGEDGKESVSESGIYMIVSMLLGIIIWMFIVMFGGQVMSSVIEEKNSRVVEVLISSVKAVDLMFGKIIGVALVALTQFMLWIVLSVVLVSVAGAFIGQDMLKDISSNPQMMAQTMGVSPEQLSALNLGQAGGSVAVDLSAGDSASAITASSPAAAGDSALAPASADSLSAAAHFPAAGKGYDCNPGEFAYPADRTGNSDPLPDLFLYGSGAFPAFPCHRHAGRGNLSIPYAPLQQPADDCGLCRRLRTTGPGHGISLLHTGLWHLSPDGSRMAAPHFPGCHAAAGS